jgi:hypothetical protein
LAAFLLSFAVVDFNELALPDGQALAYFYYEDQPGRRLVAKLLTRGGGHATDRARNSLRQERKAKRICRSESVFLATDRSIFCISVMACSSMRTALLASFRKAESSCTVNKSLTPDV